MARTGRDLGHEYMALTDHSPRLKVARGLSPERLRQQLDVVAEVNERLAPFRLLTGIEVDINEDGSLDQEDELLARLDVVVASVHSKLRMESELMTPRMIAAVRNPHTDILGHCTGRLVTRARGRPESTFDADAVFAACAETDTAVEINSRPERLDPPRRLLKLVVAAGCKVAIDTDGHAPGQLDWQMNGCRRAAECDVPTGVDRQHLAGRPTPGLDGEPQRLGGGFDVPAPAAGRRRRRPPRLAPRRPPGRHALGGGFGRGACPPPARRDADGADAGQLPLRLEVLEQDVDADRPAVELGDLDGLDDGGGGGRGQGAGPPGAGVVVLLGGAQGSPQDVTGEVGRDEAALVEQPAVAVEHQRHRPVGDPQRLPEGDRPPGGRLEGDAEHPGEIVSQVVELCLLDRHVRRIGNPGGEP